MTQCQLFHQLAVAHDQRLVSTPSAKRVLSWIMHHEAAHHRVFYVCVFVCNYANMNTLNSEHFGGFWCILASMNTKWLLNSHLDIWISNNKILRCEHK